MIFKAITRETHPWRRDWGDIRCRDWIWKLKGRLGRYRLQAHKIIIFPAHNISICIVQKMMKKMIWETHPWRRDWWDIRSRDWIWKLMGALGCLRLQAKVVRCRWLQCGIDFICCRLMSGWFCNDDWRIRWRLVIGIIILDFARTPWNLYFLLQ